MGACGRASGLRHRAAHGPSVGCGCGSQAGVPVAPSRSAAAARLRRAAGGYVPEQDDVEDALALNEVGPLAEPGPAVQGPVTAAPPDEEEDGVVAQEGAELAEEHAAPEPEGHSRDGAEEQAWDAAAD